MVDGELFDKLGKMIMIFGSSSVYLISLSENIARIVRQDDRPFGGIQVSYAKDYSAIFLLIRLLKLILSGDFCQLPPVPQKPEKNKEAIAIRFAFDAATWPKCVGNPVTLTHVFRQKDQGSVFNSYEKLHIFYFATAFVDMLNSMRFGVMEPKTIEAFQNLSRPVVYEDGIEATELYIFLVQYERAKTLIACLSDIQLVSRSKMRTRPD